MSGRSDGPSDVGCRKREPTVSTSVSARDVGSRSTGGASSWRPAGSQRADSPTTSDRLAVGPPRPAAPPRDLTVVAGPRGIGGRVGPSLPTFRQRLLSSIPVKLFPASSGPRSDFITWTTLKIHDWLIDWLDEWPYCHHRSVAVPRGIVGWVEGRILLVGGLGPSLTVGH